MGICPFRRDIVYRLSVLSLIARHHIHWLLQQVEIEVLVGKGGREVEVSVYESLGSGIEKRVDVRLVPASLLYGLELRV